MNTIHDGDELWWIASTSGLLDDAEIFSLQNDILEGILGWDITKLSKGVIQFEHETAAFNDRVKSLPNSVGFFLPPTDLQLVMRLAKKVDSLP